MEAVRRGSLSSRFAVGDAKLASDSIVSLITLEDDSDEGALILVIRHASLSCGRFDDASEDVSAGRERSIESTVVVEGRERLRYSSRSSLGLPLQIAEDLLEIHEVQSPVARKPHAAHASAHGTNRTAQSRHFGREIPQAAGDSRTAGRDKLILVRAAHVWRQGLKYDI
jgi:hypothetical protein